MIIKNNNTFHLQGKNISYIMTLNEIGDLFHHHFGGKMADRDYSVRNENPVYSLISYDEKEIYLEAQAQEYPAYGYTDLRMPAYTVRHKFGNSVTRMVYKSHEIKEDAVAYVKGMPALFKGDKSAQTLEITLWDEAVGLEAVLSYTVFDEYDVILRSTKLVNKSGEKMIVESAYSTNIDFDKADFDLVYFPGAWCREREFIRTSIRLGEKIDISNARGGSGHAMNPFVMICDRNATERNGEVFGFSLIYSGDHSSLVECDQYGNVRVMQGINPHDFEYELKPEEEFYTPQSVMSYSGCGFGGISREMHDVYRNNLCRSKWAKENRPILINNWEGTYFDFNEEKLVSMAKKAKSVGVELFVLDDGWFGKRDDDRSSLGDWFVNEKKLPSGIKGLAEKINEEGLLFGLWFEPEMVNPDSELYRKHPDWAIHVPNMNPALGRFQLMLDLAKPEVCDYIIEAVGSILASANIAYVKWDYNRMMSDRPFKGYNYKYTLGLYRVFDTLTERFPNVLFEGCASGGGRFDPGILAYSPQIWTSDNSDAISRLKIQYSTSMCYPLSAISAHVTASPNHQVGRLTSLKTRAEVAYAGIFGYELDITTMSDEECEEVKKQIEFYNEIKELVRTGDMYRLQSPYDSECCTWQVVSKDKKTTFLFSCRVISYHNFKDARIHLEGLESNLEYTDTETGITYGGDELMFKGMRPEYEKADFATFVKVYKAI